MKLFIRFLFFVFLTTTLIVLGYLGVEKYKKLSWKMFTEEQGVYLGMSRDDLIFKTDIQLECLVDFDPRNPDFRRLVDEEKKYNHHECNTLGVPVTVDYRHVSDIKKIKLVEDKVVWWSSSPLLFGDRFPFSTYDVNDMITVLGEPDILWVSGSLKKRKYTYLNHRTVFGWIKDELSYYSTGDLIWSDTVEISPDFEVRDESLIPMTKITGKYFLRGNQVCPSLKCPFNEDGSLKDDYPYKTPFDFPL